jgi:hypothetical protein
LFEDVRKFYCRKCNARDRILKMYFRPQNLAAQCIAQSFFSK